MIAASEEGKFLSLGVGHIPRNIKYARGQPQQREGDGAQLLTPVEMPTCRQGKNELTQGSPEIAHPMAKKGEYGMPRLMEQEINAIQKPELQVNARPGDIEGRDSKGDESEHQDSL